MLAQVNAAELERLNAAAGDAVRRLQQITGWRARLLEQAAAAEGPAASLSVALGRHLTLAAESLRARLQIVQQRFGELRREAWIQWVISHRSQSVYAELLELIAHGIDSSRPCTATARRRPHRAAVSCSTPPHEKRQIPNAKFQRKRSGWHLVFGIWFLEFDPKVFQCP